MPTQTNDQKYVEMTPETRVAKLKIKYSKEFEYWTMRQRECGRSTPEEKCYSAKNICTSFINTYTFVLMYSNHFNRQL